jgi:hypothetical protein
MKLLYKTMLRYHPTTAGNKQGISTEVYTRCEPYRITQVTEACDVTSAKPHNRPATMV